MIKISAPKVRGFEEAVHGARSSFDSWGQSDSYTGCDQHFCGDCPYEASICPHTKVMYFLGEKDLKLLQNLSKGPSSEAKFRRNIDVIVTVKAPLYWWKEYDTYKIGTVTQSTSTMHRIQAKKFTIYDFSHDHLLRLKDLVDDAAIWVIDDEDLKHRGGHWEFNDAEVIIQGDDANPTFVTPFGILEATIAMLNRCRELYLKTNDKKYWWQMIQLLPSSYIQQRDLKLNYEVLHTIYNDRRHHRLDEWHEFCNWIETLPYAEGIIFPMKEEN